MWGLRGPATFSGPRCRFRRIGTVAASPSSRLRCHRSFNCGLECGLIGDQMSQCADITALFGSHWCLHREPNLKTVPGLHKRWRISRPISGPLSGERMARMARFENSAPLAQRWKPARHCSDASAFTRSEHGGPIKFRNGFQATFCVDAFYADDCWKDDFVAIPTRLF
jgi:hypothetical protein